MKDTTLYRKYRPKTFNEVLGQEHITKTLAGQIENKRFSHAYLFAGTKGTGKTSIARIFAGEIGTEDRDLYEIDAASNRRIDDIRELRQSIQVLPFASPYKVYIIDEAHMLTSESFNALLKSLEEPPEHVVFILATTELHKIPDTIQSRCEMYRFRKPSQKHLEELVLSVAKKEGYELERGAAQLIAMLGDGAFRDTLGILQKILNALGEEKSVTAQKVSELTDAPSVETLHNFLKALAAGELEKLLTLVQKLKAQNTDLKLFLQLVLQKIRVVLLMRFAADMKNELIEGFSQEEVRFLEDLSEDAKNNINSKTLTAMLSALQEMKDAYVPELPIELALVRTFGHNSENGSAETQK